MQKIRNLFHTPLSLTRLVVGSGIALFLAGFILLLPSASAPNISAARQCFVWAGWALTAGWVLKRAEDRQWPFVRYSRGQRPLACVFAMAFGAVLSHSYSLAVPSPSPSPVPVPVPVAIAARPGEGTPPFSPSRSLQPPPSPFLSLTNAPESWDFDRFGGGSSRFSPRGARFGFSSQVMTAPPALSGKLPSSWDIQP